MLTELASVPGFRPSVSAWARAAAAVVTLSRRDAVAGHPHLVLWPRTAQLFATHIAKYFANAVREAMLLELCNGGIVFLPGPAGTMQEIFQDACENYYGAPETMTPMVLVGGEHWERRFPAWPMLQSLAPAGRWSSGSSWWTRVDEALAVLGD